MEDGIMEKCTRLEEKERERERGNAMQLLTQRAGNSFEPKEPWNLDLWTLDLG